MAVGPIQLVYRVRKPTSMAVIRPTQLLYKERKPASIVFIRPIQLLYKVQKLAHMAVIQSEEANPYGSYNLHNCYTK